MPAARPSSLPPAARADEADLARRVLRAEADAVLNVRIEEPFHRAVDLVLDATTEPKHGSIVVTGLGKSGLIGAKLSATLASTGTPSHFLHPTEAMHGDLGRIRRGDVVLAISYSGATDEIVSLATILKQDGIAVIALVGRAECDLGRVASLAVCVGDVTEACPNNLAPTASTTAMLALGDALALCVSRRRNFGPEEFKKFHPGGALGRELMTVGEAMRFHAGRNLALIDQGLSIEQAYDQAEALAPGGRRAGALVVVDETGKLVGIFTDGDLRRLFIKRHGAGWREPIGQCMTKNPRRLLASALVRDAVQMMREMRIDEIPVVDAHDRPVGLIDVQDLVALKVIEE